MTTAGRAEARPVIAPGRWSRLAGLLLVVGCNSDGGLGPELRAPEILSSGVVANPDNVLSAVVSARVRFADSVVIRYGLATAAMDSAAPAVTLLGDSAVVPVLGLLPDTSYRLQVLAYGDGQTAMGEMLAFQSGPLPADLPRYTASGPNPSPGYVVFAAEQYGLVIDNTGRVVWYHRFADGPGLNFMAQPNGRYAARPTTPDPTDRDPWVEIDVLGEVTRTFGCARDLVPRFHDLIAQEDGSYWVMCDETRTMDLSGVGGVANARVTGTVVQRMSPTGSLVFEWSPFDHLDLTDLDSASRAGTSVNWTHGNSLDLDAQGNLVVSFRSLSEITMIDTRTGDVLWRMGGLRNQFSFEGAPTPAFFRQHGVRLTSPGQLLLLDNLGDPAGSRAELYAYDREAHTARLVGSFAPRSPVIASLGGTTQTLPNGHTLVSFGNGGRVEEYDAAGALVWQIDGNTGYVFRAQRIRSLYSPGTGGQR